MLDPERFNAVRGRVLFDGAELLVKGARECGWPVAGVVGHAFGRPARVLRACSDYGELKVESVMTPQRLVGALRSMAEAGAQQGGGAVMGVIGRTVLRSVAEAMEQLAPAGWPGDEGVVLVIVDDERRDGPTIDPRAVMEQLGVPLLMPASPQQLKDMFEPAVTLSRLRNGPVAVTIGHDLIDGGGTVDVRPNRGSLEAEASRRRGRPGVAVAVGDAPGAPRERVISEALRSGINRLWNRPPASDRQELGFVSCGPGLAALRHLLTELDLNGEFPLLELGLASPVDAALVRRAGACCRRLVVVEEGRGWLEREVHQALSGVEDAARVYGKRLPDDRDGVPTDGDLNPSELLERLAPLIVEATPAATLEWVQRRVYGLLERARRARNVLPPIELPVRTPTFPPGSVHRETAGLLQDLMGDLADAGYMSDEHQRGSIALRVYHGHDEARHIRQPPFDALNAQPIEAYAPRHRGSDDDGGMDVVLINDELLAGPGRALLQQAFDQAERSTFIVAPRGDGFLNEDAVFDAKRTVRQARALIPFARRGSCRVDRVDPRDRSRYRQLLERTILSGEVNVLVLNDKGPSDRLPPDAPDDEPRVNIATAVDEFDPSIVRRAGCPTLRILQTPDGPRYQTDRAVPLRNAAYRRINASPAFERVAVIRGSRAPVPAERLDLPDPPDPPAPRHAGSERWHGLVSGVAGRGVETMTRLLLEGGHAMGYDAEYLMTATDAEQSAPVISSVVYAQPPAQRPAASNRAGPRTTARPFQGAADLLLGLDLIEAARVLRRPVAAAEPSRTYAIVNTEFSSTMRQLLGDDPMDAATVTSAISECVQPDPFQAINAGKLGFRLFRTSIYLPAIVAGIAFQHGLLPLTRPALEHAVRRVWRTNAAQALAALRIGRLVATQPQLLDVGPTGAFDPTVSESPHRQLARCRRHLRQITSKRRCDRFIELVEPPMLHYIEQGVPFPAVRRLIRRAADAMVFGGDAHAELFLQRVHHVQMHDRAELGFAATETVIDGLARTMLVKDAFYVAALLTHPAKMLEDRRRYDVSNARGDRLTYERTVQPEFELFGRVFPITLRTSGWQLRWLARSGYLRRLMPRWRRRDRAFSEAYVKPLESPKSLMALTDSSESYEYWCQRLGVPRAVFGFGSERRRRLISAQRRLERLEQEGVKLPLTQNQRPPIESEPVELTAPG